MFNNWSAPGEALRKALSQALPETLWGPVRRSLRERWEALRRVPDAGYTTETVVVTAALVALAVLVLAILIAAVANKANSIVL